MDGGHSRMGRQNPPIQEARLLAYFPSEVEDSRAIIGGKDKVMTMSEQQRAEYLLRLESNDDVSDKVRFRGKRRRRKIVNLTGHFDTAATFIRDHSRNA
jgi:hypothetical protein